MLDQTIHLKSKNQSYTPIVTMVQGDTGRNLRCAIDDLTVEDTYIATVYCEKNDGTVVFNKCTIDADTEEIVCDMKEGVQLITCTGHNMAQLCLWKDSTLEERVSSFIFDIFVTESKEGGVESTSQFTALEQTILNAESALKLAEEMKAEIATAVAEANEAVTKANEAVSSANTAITEANSAVEKANVATSEATQAAETANASATNADNTVKPLKSISATATTLEAGSQATAIFTVGEDSSTLSLGIPQGVAGNDGKDGKDGTNGNDGVSPTVSITDITGGHKITITDASGSHEVDVMDGEQGGKGDTGFSPSIDVTQENYNTTFKVTNEGGVNTYSIDLTALAQEIDEASSAASLATEEAKAAAEQASNVNITQEQYGTGSKITTTDKEGNQVTTEIVGTNIHNLVCQAMLLRRDGRIFGSKVPHYSYDTTTSCIKTRSNEGLVCEPSTDTVEGQDDYEDISLFKWVHCNYVREDDGTPIVTALEGDSNYSTTGSVDVGTLSPTIYFGIIEGDDYDEWLISDSAHEELVDSEGNAILHPWCTAVRTTGEVLPYMIIPSYISGVASDGLLRSQPNLKVEAFQSYQTLMTNYQKKGTGYHGANIDRGMHQILMFAIKYATKSSQTAMQGCTGYSFQYTASIESGEANTYFPVTNSEANNIIVGSSVIVGYPAQSDHSIDRGATGMRDYALGAKVLSIEDLGDGNSAVYLDVDTPFTTEQVDGYPVYMSSWHWSSGSTDNVLGHHDGSLSSNTDGKHPYRIQGVEHAVGGYELYGNTVMVFLADASKDVYVAPKGVAISTDVNTIKSTYTNIGNIPGNDGTDYWAGDVALNAEVMGFHNSAIGGSSSTGCGDMNYGGGTGSVDNTQEYLIGGLLRDWATAGACYLNGWGGLGDAYWGILSAD